MTRTPQPDGYNVYSTVTGKVLTTRWEDPKNHKTGFGYYVKTQAEDGNLHYYVHLDENYGNGFNEDNNEVKRGDYIGRIETEDTEWGNANGTHVHHEKRVRNDEGKLVSVDPGEENPLKINSKMTVGFDVPYPGSGPDDPRLNDDDEDGKEESKETKKEESKKTKMIKYKGVDFAPLPR